VFAKIGFNYTNNDSIKVNKFTDSKVCVTYTEYGNSEWIDISSIQTIDEYTNKNNDPGISSKVW
jgi:hypothetical protein